MKKVFWIFLGIFLLSAGFVSAQNFGRYEGTQTRKVIVQKKEQWKGCGDFDKPLRITTLTTNPPFGWREQGENGFMVANGFGVDLIKQIAQEEKISLTTVGFQSDDDMKSAFESGQVDMWVGAYYDPKIRGNGHAYLTPAFIPNVITVVFLKNKARPIKSFEDLKGLKGAVRQDEHFYPYVRLSIPKELDIQEVFDSKEAFTKLITGEVDYLLSSPYSAEAEARRFKLNKYIKLIGTPLLGQELFIVYSKNSACPQYRGIFMKKLAEKRQDLNALKRSLINFIDTWGQRFKNDPSLIAQLKAEGTIPLDFSLDTENKAQDNPENKIQDKTENLAGSKE